MTLRRMRKVGSKKVLEGLLEQLKRELVRVHEEARRWCASEGRQTAGCYDYARAVEDWFTARGYRSQAKQGWFAHEENYHWWVVVPVANIKVDYIVDLTQGQFFGPFSVRVQLIDPRSPIGKDYLDRVREDS